MLELIELPRVVEGASLLAELASDAGSEAAATTQEFWSISGVFTLGMLVLLQAVLGFDNLLYISIESKRVPLDKQSMVRRWGIGLAIAFSHCPAFHTCQSDQTARGSPARVSSSRQRFCFDVIERAQSDCAVWGCFHSLDSGQGNLSHVGKR